MAINRVRTTDSHYFMGQFEMTDKLAVMVLCYLVKETFTLIDDQPANVILVLFSILCLPKLKKEDYNLFVSCKKLYHLLFAGLKIKKKINFVEV